MRRAPILASGLSIPLVLALTLPGGASVLPDRPGEEEPGQRFFLTEPSTAAAEDVAQDFLRLKAGDYGVSAADLADLRVMSQHTSEHNGVTYVNLVQYHQDREVFGGVATVSVMDDGVVLHVSESLVPDLRQASGAAGIEAPEAVVAAAAEVDLDAADVEVKSQETGAERETLMSPAGISDEDIPARLFWQPTEDGLRLAWEVTIDDDSTAHLWNVAVDAETGDALSVEDWTDHHHASDFHGLARSPQQFEATATRWLPATLSAAALAGSPNPVEDGSSYRVFAFPAESPNDADRTVVTNPADAEASPFGWHDLTGTPGADHLTTRGNNVHAYTDRDNDGLPDPGSDPDGGSSLTFDFPLDESEHALNYSDAAVANLFYANNIVHDVLHHYGFDEAAGNFQVTNYTGAGRGGDDVRAEAMDGGGVNNANFSTPARDGERPRMQMYLWPGAQFGLPNGVTLGTGADAVTYDANFAFFSPAPTNAGLPGDAVVVDNACASFDAPGAIVVTDRSPVCTPHTQTRNAEAAGAAALVISHNATGDAPRLSGSMAPAVDIPVVSVSQADGAALREQIASGTTSASVHKISTHPAIRDGDYENGIIIHEYGHGVSNRLTGGADINCLSGQEQMGEGWSDYLAITMLLDPALDDPEQARGMGPYALYQDDRSGGGIRPRPYSRDMTIQPFTYDRIKTGGWLNGATLATPHGVGHGWAATLWDLNWDLIDKHDFTEDVYAAWDTAGNTRAMQYVMDGMKLQGCFPGFIDGRNGVLAAAEALGGDDTCNVWASFARRGMGYSAIQGTSAGRDDNTEAFDMPPACDAPGTGLVRPLSNDDLNSIRAGATTQVRFNLGGDLGLDILRDAHSPSIQQIDCDSREPLPYALTVPTLSAGSPGLTYNPGQDRYQYSWRPDSSLSGTCQQLIITLEDGTQHRADFRLR